MHTHVMGRSRGYIIGLAWEGEVERIEVVTSSFQYLLFTPAFHCSLMLKSLWHVGPQGLQSRLIRTYLINMNIKELQGWGRHMRVVMQNG